MAKTCMHVGRQPERSRVVAALCQMLRAQDAMEFAQAHNIRSKIVLFDGIDKAPEAFAAMKDGEYRVVIKVSDE